MIHEALADYAKHIETPFEHDRMKTLGSSEVGLCLRRSWYRKNSQSADKDYVDRWGAQVRGNVIERHFWYPALKRKWGDNLLYAGPHQKTLILGKLSSTPDGVVVNQNRSALKEFGIRDLGPDRCFVIECKSIDPRIPLREAKAENEFQVQVQLGLIRELTPHKPRYALITYTNASFWDDVEEFVVTYDKSVFQEAKARSALVYGATEPRELRPEGWIAGGKECEYCPWTSECGVVRTSVPKGEPQGDVDPQFRAELEDLCRELNKLKEQVEEANPAIRDLQDQIKDRLRSRGIKKIPGLVSWSAVVGRTSYDTAAMKADGIAVEKYSKVGDPSDRLTVEKGI
jgi:Uma2 family endonuclease